MGPKSQKIPRDSPATPSPGAKKGRKRKNPVGRPSNDSYMDDGDPDAGGGGGGRIKGKKLKTNKLSKKDKEKDGEDGRKKKVKKVKPLPKSKEKAPVDVERQCGVPLPNGGFCARSLTCKTHSMGAKRAVQGRSQPYDVLLAAYQQRNQVKLASLSTQQQIDLENEALMDDTPLDEEEEFEQVMAGVVRAYPVPLERKVILPTRLRTGFFRMREMLIGSLTNVPPLPSISTTSSDSSNPPGNNSGSNQQNINAVMAATGGVLGRTIVYDTVTGAQYARPPRVYINSNNALMQHQQALYMRQRQIQMQMQIQQQNHGQNPNQSQPQGQVYNSTGQHSSQHQIQQLQQQQQRLLQLGPQQQREQLSVVSQHRESQTHPVAG